ncbi:MAG: Coenzyme F420 hydrogenase/dehydrogenase, beta subunit C-terminal domain [Wujia sp.]
MKTYAAYYDNKIREESSSGGIFSVLAQQFDVVYGVAMTEDCYGAEFVRTQNDITSLRGSKYFQAKVGDTFKQVKKDLEGGNQVLFSGTGCQVNGLKKYLQKEYDNLICVDVICHGTPSPKLWREYVMYQESKYGKLLNVNFRCKVRGWIDYGSKLNNIYFSHYKDSFMRMFLRNYCLRPSCYECQAKHYKMSDITIADFWGIEKVAPEMADGMGTSLVITRTNRGQKLFDMVKEELQWKEVSYEDGVRGNPSEYSSVARPMLRNSFFDDLKKLSFEEMEKKYAADIKVPFLIKILRKIKRLFGGGNKIKSNAGNGVDYVFKK